MSQLTETPADQALTYRDLPPHPPLEGALAAPGEHVVAPPPDLPPATPSRVRTVVGGVLAVAVVAFLIGLAGWAIGRDRSGEPTALGAGREPDVLADPGSTTSPSLPGGADEEFFGASPEDYLDRFPEARPDGRGEQFPVPDGFLDPESPFLAPDGELQLPEGRLADRFGDLAEQLERFGIPSLDLVLPDDAVVRGLSFGAVGSGEERTLGLTITFEIDGARAQLTAASVTTLPEGSPTELAGTEAVIDSDGRVVWLTAGESLLFTLASRDLETDQLVDLATEIERAMQ